MKWPSKTFKMVSSISKFEVMGVSKVNFVIVHTFSIEHVMTYY